MIRAGKLDRKITVEAETETISPAGTVTVEWQIVATLRAEVLQAGTAEALAAFGEEATATIGFRVRYFPGLTTAHRVTYDGRAFNIRDVKEIGRRRGLEIICDRVQP